MDGVGRRDGKPHIIRCGFGFSFVDTSLVDNEELQRQYTSSGLSLILLGEGFSSTTTSMQL